MPSDSTRSSSAASAFCSSAATISSTMSAPCSAGLVHLVGADDEVLAQHRNVDRGADRVQVGQRAAEPALLGEHADHARAAVCVVLRQRGRVGDRRPARPWTGCAASPRRSRRCRARAGRPSRRGAPGRPPRGSFSSSNGSAASRAARSSRTPAMIASSTVTGRPRPGTRSTDSLRKVAHKHLPLPAETMLTPASGAPGSGCARHSECLLRDVAVGSSAFRQRFPQLGVRIARLLARGRGRVPGPEPRGLPGALDGCQPAAPRREFPPARPGRARAASASRAARRRARENSAPRPRRTRPRRRPTSDQHDRPATRRAQPPVAITPATPASASSASGTSAVARCSPVSR